MMDFVKQPANKRSLLSRKLVYGVGVNDAWYMTQPRINGIQSKCPIYIIWKDMIGRVYSEKNLSRRPTYRSVSICNEWLLFSNFSDWCSRNYIKGFELDKDIKVKGNKIYSPDTCLFVSKSINRLIIDSLAIRGKCPIGVCFDKRRGKYLASISVDGVKNHIGYFDSVSDASLSYKKAKNFEMSRKSIQYPLIAKYLEQHKYRLSL
jgi:hypothetical protein